METIRFQLNGKTVELHADPAMPLLWGLRDYLSLKGCKLGCLQGVCGACTVHIDGAPTRACQTPVGSVKDRKVTTIEGLAEPIRQRLMNAWVEHQALQCGYCQTGQVMTAAALLAAKSLPDAATVQNAMAGHLCRCGAGQRVLKAVNSALRPERKAA